MVSQNGITGQLSKNYFEKLFQNYLLENKIYREDYLDINKHLIQIDLAITD